MVAQNEMIAWDIRAFHHRSSTRLPVLLQRPTQGYFYILHRLLKVWLYEISKTIEDERGGKRRATTFPSSPLTFLRLFVFLSLYV